MKSASILKAMGKIDAHTAITKSLPNPKKFNHPSIFCAQKEGSNFGTCEGDSGGPFVRFDYDPTDPKWYQVAIVHGSGESCDGTRFPSIFVRLMAIGAVEFSREGYKIR